MKSGFLARLTAAIPVLALVVVLNGCGSSASNNVQSSSNRASVGTAPVSAPVQAQTTTLTQVERLARPAINEGLLITNAYLNAYNSIPPTQDAAALAGPVGTEVVSVLTAVGNTQAFIAADVNALIPDVMRFDTTITSGYAGGVTFQGAAFTTPIASIPSGGRMLLDPVVSITLALVSRNPVASDNVTYQGQPGNPAQGHQPLSTQFPYLAPAN